MALHNLFGELALDASLQQTEPVQTTFGAVGDLLTIEPGLRTAIYAQVTGTPGTIQIKVSNDGTTFTLLSNPTLVDRLDAVAGTSSPTITAAGIYRINVSGFAFVQLYRSSGSSSATLLVTCGNGPTSLPLGGAVKAAGQTAAAADPGIPALGVRAPATPAARSSAGAWGAPLLDGEGKVLTSGTGDAAQTWQAVATLTTTTAAAVKAAAATGIRNYVTDLTVSNGSATGVLVTILDGATVVWQCWVAPGASETKEFKMPLRGTAATALNANLSAAVSSVYVAASGYLGV